MRTIIAILLTLAMPAAAQEATELWVGQYWSVNVVVFTDGDMACNMESGNPDYGHMVMIWSDVDAGDIAFQVFNVNWSGMNYDVNVRTDIDGHVFEGPGHADESSVIVHNLGDAFLNAIAGGHQLRVYDSRGEKVLDYSLRGSAAAMAQLVDCTSKLPRSNRF